jgi:hypothetical protein
MRMELGVMGELSVTFTLPANIMGIPGKGYQDNENSPRATRVNGVAR